MGSLWWSRPGSPFDLELDQDRQGRYILNLVEKVADAKSQITAMLELAYPGARLTPLELSMLEDAIRQEYAVRGIMDREPTSLYREGIKKGEQYYIGKVKKEMPTMSGLNSAGIGNCFNLTLASRENCRAGIPVGCYLPKAMRSAYSLRTPGAFSTTMWVALMGT